MDSTESRILGQLQAHHKEVHSRLLRMEAKLDSLVAESWMRKGESAIIAVLISSIVAPIVTELVIHYL